MEQWKDIPGYEGRYQVSDLGRVRGQRGILKPQKINSGYLVVHLCYCGTRQARTVQRLVARAFVAGHFDGAHVNHKDSDRLNNAADNLEWVTRTGNMQHAKAAGRMKCRRYPVVGIAVTDGAEIRFDSQVAAEIALCGRNSSAIYHCITGKKKSAYGYTWRRA